MTTLSVNSSALAILLRDVRQASGQDSGLPMLSGVQLWTASAPDGTPVLVASATDRYCLLQGHVSGVVGSLPGPVWLRNGQVSQLMSILRSFTSRRRASDGQTEITVDDDRVSVRQALLGDDVNVALSFAHDVGADFPDIMKLIRPAMDAGPADNAFHIDPRHLVKLARIAAARGFPMRVRASGSAKPVVVQIGTNLVALAMPIRPSAEADVPVFAAPVLAEAVAA